MPWIVTVCPPDGDAIRGIYRHYNKSCFLNAYFSVLDVSDARIICPIPHLSNAVVCSIHHSTVSCRCQYHNLAHR